ncbi:hypothetical protein AVEN_213754-1, partial [Araneus ventricosus]
RFFSESDEDVSLDHAKDWCRLGEDNLGPPPRFPFTVNSVIKAQIHNSSPLEFFGIILDDDIGSETNSFAEDFIENNELKPNSRSQNWKGTYIDTPWDR